MNQVNQRMYISPFEERYTSPEMLSIFSNHKKYVIWRHLWLELAKAQRNLGLDITDEQIKELEKNVNNIDFESVRKHEEKIRHDVVAHIRAYAEVCPTAGKIIHLGATSAFVTDNTDLIIIKAALFLVRNYLVNLIDKMRKFALKNKDLETMAFTHFQRAQLTTVGKRACLWLSDFVDDLKELDFVIDSIKFLGAKGAVGTQASYLGIFKDKKKVKELDRLLACAFGFKKWLIVSGQTYSRKLDSRVCAVLSNIAQSLYKFAADIRLLQHDQELYEPFEREQVGSSAMPYKRNPVLCERICSLARFIISLQQNQAFSTASQWFERTLDDSASRRVTLPEMFFAADAVLRLAIYITEGLQVNRGQIKKNVMNHLPLVATEEILARAASSGKDRQKLHEKLRKHSLKSSDLISTLKKDPAFKGFVRLLRPALYVGIAGDQVGTFIKNEVEPILKRNKNLIGIKVEIRV